MTERIAIVAGAFGGGNLAPRRHGAAEDPLKRVLVELETTRSGFRVGRAACGQVDDDGNGTLKHRNRQQLAAFDRSGLVFNGFFFGGIDGVVRLARSLCLDRAGSCAR